MIKVKKEMEVMEAIETNDTGETNYLILAGASVVTDRLGLKTTGRSERTSQSKFAATRRIERDLAQYRKDLSRITDVERRKIRVRNGEYLQKKYNIIEKVRSQIREILNEKIKTRAHTTKRF